MSYAGLEGVRKAGFNDLGKAAEFLTNRLGLAYDGLEHAILRPLCVDKIMTEDLLRGLELAVDAAITLFKTAGIPGDIEMKQMPAMGLEVESLSGGIGGDQDA